MYRSMDRQTDRGSSRHRVTKNMRYVCVCVGWCMKYSQKYRGRERMIIENERGKRKKDLEKKEEEIGAFYVQYNSWL